MNRHYSYYNNCVNWPKGDIDGLHEIVDNSQTITRKTFLKHVNYKELKHIEKGLGYSLKSNHGLTMAGDWCVSYHKSILHGKTVYFFCYSSIEYIFVKEGE